MMIMKTLKFELSLSLVQAYQAYLNPLMRAIKLKNNAHWASGPSAVLCLHCNKQKKIGARFPSGSKHLIEPQAQCVFLELYAHKWNCATPKVPKYTRILSGNPDRTRIMFYSDAWWPNDTPTWIILFMCSIRRHVSRRSLPVFSLCNSTLLNGPLTVPKKKVCCLSKWCAIKDRKPMRDRKWACAR